MTLDSRTLLALTAQRTALQQQRSAEIRAQIDEMAQKTPYHPLRRTLPELLGFFLFDLAESDRNNPRAFNVGPIPHEQTQRAFRQFYQWRERIERFLVLHFEDQGDRALAGDVVMHAHFRGNFNMSDLRSCIFRCEPKRHIAAPHKIHIEIVPQELLIGTSRISTPLDLDRAELARGGIPLRHIADGGLLPDTMEASQLSPSDRFLLRFHYTQEWDIQLKPHVIVNLEERYPRWCDKFGLIPTKRGR